MRQLILILVLLFTFLLLLALELLLGGGVYLDLGPIGDGALLQEGLDVLNKERVEQIHDLLLLRDEVRPVERNPHALEVHGPDLHYASDLLAAQDAVPAATGHLCDVEQLRPVDHVVVGPADDGDAVRLDLVAERLLVLPHRCDHAGLGVLLPLEGKVVWVEHGHHCAGRVAHLCHHLVLLLVHHRVDGVAHLGAHILGVLWIHVHLLLLRLWLWLLWLHLLTRHHLGAWGTSLLHIWVLLHLSLGLGLWVVIVVVWLAWLALLLLLLHQLLLLLLLS